MMLARLIPLLILSSWLIGCAARNDQPIVASTATPIEPAATRVIVSPTAPPTATPTPAPELRQLTSGACCVQPAWSPDSKQVLFIDKPSDTAPIGIYAINVSANPSQAPQVIGRVGIYSNDRSLIAYPESNQTIVEKLTTGDSWVIPNQGQSVSFAPDDRHLAWEQEEISGPYDQRRNDLYLANVDGADSGRITRLYGGGLIGWLPNGLKVVFEGRPSLEVLTSTLTVLDLTTNVAVDLVSAQRLSGISISNGGSWLAYFISFDADPSRNGIWLERSDGSQARQLDLWGAYQWRDDSHLLVIPTRVSSNVPFELWEVEAGSGASRQLTQAAVTPLTILNGDWRVSPDGQWIVFVNSVDRNLWLLNLPK
jgi:hypothetical protein